MSLTDIANIAKELLTPVRGFIRWLWGGLQWLYRHLLRSKRAKFYGLRDDIRSVRVRTGTLLTGEPSPLSDHGDPEDLGYEVDAGVLVRNLQSVGLRVPERATSPWWHQYLEKLEVYATSRGYKEAKKLEGPPKGGGLRPSSPFDW